MTLSIPAHVLRSLPSPCLVVDVAAVDRNIARGAELVAGHAAKLRPHFKAHKSTTLMRRQIAAGACAGATAQTTWEALALARAGVDDILVAAPIADEVSLRELAEVAATTTRTTIVVDDVAHVALAEAALAEGQLVRVFIELDVGSGRTGLPYGDPRLLQVAEAIAQAARLSLAGIQAYEGFAVLRDDRSVRETLVRQVASQVAAERARLEAAGHEMAVVSGGGTGTAEASVRFGVHDELQIGSYVLMDASYDAIDLPFEQAIACVAHCVSRREPAAAVLNAGLKALAVDHGLPRPALPGSRPLGLSDEHMRISLADGVQLSVGDAVLVVPGHLDPTVNLHEVLFAWHAATGRMERWPVDARHAASQRVEAFGDLPALRLELT